MWVCCVAVALALRCHSCWSERNTLMWCACVRPQVSAAAAAAAVASPNSAALNPRPLAGGYNPHGGLSAVQADIMNFFNAPDAQGDAGISLDDVSGCLLLQLPLSVLCSS